MAETVVRWKGITNMTIEDLIAVLMEIIPNTQLGEDEDGHIFIAGPRPASCGDRYRKDTPHAPCTRARKMTHL